MCIRDRFVGIAFLLLRLRTITQHIPRTLIRGVSRFLSFNHGRTRTPHSKQYLALEYLRFLMNSPPRPLSFAHSTFSVNFCTSVQQTADTSTLDPFIFSIAFSADSLLQCEFRSSMRLHKLNPRNTLALACFLVSENGHTTREQRWLHELRDATTGFKEFRHVVIRVGEGQHRDVNRAADGRKPSSSRHEDLND